MWEGQNGSEMRSCGGGIQSNPQMEAKPDDDALLSDFLSSLIDYTPTIPDELTEYYLGRSGFQCPDLTVTRLVSVATQKFIGEIASDALQLCKLKQSAPTKDKRDKQIKDKRFVLTTEDLSVALREYGVNIKRNEYFVDNPTAGLTPVAKDKIDD
eukprot:c21653_g1_i1 orf=568-1032(-)